MPCYDFKCPKCEHEFENITLKYDTEKKPIKAECPKCKTPSPTFMPFKSRNKVSFRFNYMEP